MPFSDVQRRAGLVIERRRSKPPRLPEPSEEMVHRTVVAHIERRAMPGVVHFHVPNGEARGRGVGGKLKAMGTRAGVPDLLIVHRGCLYALELKRTGGRLSDAQRTTLAEFEAAGARTAVAYGLDEALGRLTEWGLIR